MENHVLNQRITVEYGLCGGAWYLGHKDNLLHPLTSEVKAQEVRDYIVDLVSYNNEIVRVYVPIKLYNN